ncbi:MAG: tRNA epoxyqueuosine(34) reductase QueG [Planctomycetaceae bacterium]|jgi:epoxyqueuosine reductase|nr:tRNA epoxyqueuosine(34) reductase QueG [Planctomycetaceae bacterium]
MNATDELKTTAFQLGFELCGVAPAEQPKTLDAFEHWIDAGQHAGMNYLAEKRSARKHPDSVLHGVRSILMLGVSFAAVLGSEEHPVKQLTGVAEYARGIDYHHWIRRRLRKLAVKYRELFPNGQCRGVVDTAPILEKQFAVEAGLGQIGYNTLLINPQYGSKIFLAAFLSTEYLQTEKHRQTNIANSEDSNVADSKVGTTIPCNNCRRCLASCPTKALVQPFVLDARRCLNYWTIEHRGEIPAEIQNKLGQHFFGCDICVNICPCNQNCPTIPQGTINPQSLTPETLHHIANGSPLERMFR